MVLSRAYDDSSTQLPDTGCIDSWVFRSYTNIFYNISNFIYRFITIANLLLTPFATAVVPPPMSLMKVTFKAPVNQVCFGKSPHDATVFLSDGSTHCITIPVSETEEQIDSKPIKIVR